MNRRNFLKCLAWTAIAYQIPGVLVVNETAPAAPVFTPLAREITTYYDTVLLRHAAARLTITPEIALTNLNNFSRLKWNKYQVD